MKSKAELSEFPKDKRLDDLYFDNLGILKFKKLASIVSLVLTLSHGQASVERGFSQNNSVLQVNQSADTIISKRIIKDHMLANDLKPFTIEINSSLIKAFRSARMKYEEFLKSKKEMKSANEVETKAHQISSDIEKLKVQCKTLERTVEMLNTEFVDCIKHAEEKNDMSLVKKGNALKRKSEESKSELEILSKQIEDLKQKRKKLLH